MLIVAEIVLEDYDKLRTKDLAILLQGYSEWGSHLKLS